MDSLTGQSKVGTIGLLTLLLSANDHVDMSNYKDYQKYNVSCLGLSSNCPLTNQEI